MSQIKPITPSAAKEKYESGANTPDMVVEVVNKLIDKNYHPNGFFFYRDDVINALLVRHGTITRQEIFDQKWLDFEWVFRNYGWTVDYENENPPLYRFKGPTVGR